MSATSTCYLIIGVELEKLCDFVEESDTYVVHDERTGKPTGENKVDKKARLVFRGNLADIKLTWEKDYWSDWHWEGVCSEELEDLFEGLDCKRVPDMNGVCGGRVVGRTLLDGRYDSSLVTTDINKLLDTIAVVKQSFEDLGFDVEPKIHMIHHYS